MSSLGTCPACDGVLTLRHAGAWCDRCHIKVEGCCEGAPTPACATAPEGAVPRRFTTAEDGRWGRG